MLHRRDWLRLLAALGSAQAQEPKPNGPRVDKETLVAALRAMGLEFTDPQLNLMLPRIGMQLGRLEKVRTAAVPLDTEPAFAFSPVLPGKKFPRVARFTPSRVAPFTLPKKPEDIAFQPVPRLAFLLRNRRISSVELTRLYLERLKHFGPRLNCVITMTDDLALDQARRADREIRAGRYKGPLHGVPWGAKDLLAVKGFPTTWGAEPFQNQVIDLDATVVQRLEKAGAVLVAKLSMGALAMGGLWFGGMTKTPWNLEMSSSGSSAGSASATAAGLVGFSIGTETLGSIVSPSIRCGTVGLRPTYGRVSRHGAMALSWTMDKIGPICRGVEDCAMVLRAIHGPDGLDTTVIDAPFSFEAGRRLATLRVGVVQKEIDAMPAEEKAVYDQALQDLRKAGVKLQPVEPPEFDVDSLLVILSAEGATAFDDLTRNGGVNQLKDQGSGAWPNSFRSSRLIPAVEYLRAQRLRRLLMRQFEAFMAPWDVLVSAPDGLLTPTNLTGHPQVVVPCGFVKGMPRGLVFTGRLCEEGLPLRVALAFERATKWHTMRPPVV